MPAPPSLGDIFKRATISVRERGSTSFVPAIDEAGLAQLAEWPVEPFEIVQLGTGEVARFQLQQQGIASGTSAGDAAGGGPGSPSVRW